MGEEPRPGCLHIRFGDRVDGPYGEEQLREALPSLPAGVEVWVEGAWADLAVGLDRVVQARSSPGSRCGRPLQVASGQLWTGSRLVHLSPGVSQGEWTWSGTAWVPREGTQFPPVPDPEVNSSRTAQSGTDGVNLSGNVDAEAAVAGQRKSTAPPARPEGSVWLSGRWVVAAPGTVVDGLRWTGETWVPPKRVRTQGELIQDGNSVLRLIAWAGGLALLGILVWQWEHVVAFALAALLAIPLVLTIGWLTKWDESVLVVAVVGALVLAVAAGFLGFDAPEDERSSTGGPGMARNWSQSNLYDCLSRLGYATERGSVEFHDSYIVLKGASDPRVPSRLQLDWIESEQLFVFHSSPTIGGSFDSALDAAGCPA